MKTKFKNVLLLALISFVVTATSCTKKETTKTTFDAADLAGTWKGDFEKSWEVSKDDFMADTIRGEDAYPKDKSAKEKIVRQEIEPIVSGMVCEFGNDGKFKGQVMGDKLRGKYEAAKEDSNSFAVTVSLPTRKRPYQKNPTPERKLKLEIEFLNQDLILVRIDNVAIAYTRSKN